ncbi:MAG: hypothetical protein E7595_02110 [Ruminococcaceae bacterium]|nr:hypothetical protein [Oscillospiraceae bacterium]
MNYIGKWHFHSICVFDEKDGLVYLSADEYLASPMMYIDENDPEAVADEMKERKGMIGTQISIDEDGKLYLLMPIPEGVSKEEVQAAAESGEITLYDGMITQAPLAWEERNGVLWYDTAIKGEVFDEEADSWVKAIDEDGFLSLMNIRFVKAE